MRGRVRFGEFVGAVEPLFWKRVATRRCRARLALRLRLGERFTSGKTGKNADHGPGALAAGKRLEFRLFYMVCANVQKFFLPIDDH